MVKKGSGTDILIDGSKMTFPLTERFIYDRNPLVAVICQLVFPPILRIGSEAPATFQESIRHIYPLFEEKKSGALPAGLPPEISRLLAGDMPPAPTTYEFSTIDNAWTISLGREFIALTCRQYRKWEEFKEHLRVPLAALTDIYSPACFVRVGLRYQDLINPVELELAEEQWSSLLNPAIAGIIGDPYVANRVEQSVSQTLLRLDDFDGHVQLRYGLYSLPNQNPPTFMIDSDFFTQQKMETNNAIQVLDKFNGEARRLFRWSIGDRTHEAMVPRPVS